MTDSTLEDAVNAWSKEDKEDEMIDSIAEFGEYDGRQFQKSTKEKFNTEYYTTDSLPPDINMQVHDYLEEHGAPLKFCYDNARKVACQINGVEYVEGVIISSENTRVRNHAWNQYNNTVFDITMSHEERYGISISHETIKDIHNIISQPTVERIDVICNPDTPPITALVP